MPGIKRTRALLLQNKQIKKVSIVGTFFRYTACNQPNAVAARYLDWIWNTHTHIHTHTHTQKKKGSKHYSELQWCNQSNQM